MILGKIGARIEKLADSTGRLQPGYLSV